MHRKINHLTFILLIGALVLAACGSESTPVVPAPPPTALLPALTTSQVNVEGQLAPRSAVDLAFRSSGQVSEILVAEGDEVEAGTIIARLGDRAELEAAIARAEFTLLEARQARQRLDTDLPEAQNDALEEIRAAREGVREAERRLWGFDVPSEPIDIEVARANVALARKALVDARKDFEPYENKPEDNLKRAALLNKLAEAQQRYDHAVEQLNRLSGVTVAEFELDQAQTELQIAETRLALAEEHYQLLQSGPDPDEIAAADSRIKSAETALAAALAAVERLDLIATLSGTVVSLDLTLGQQVTAGQPVVTLADLAHMIAETTDLNETDVVRVRVGQPVTLIPDAVPELELSGVVESIRDQAELKGGDVTYTARIRLDELDPRLRWGMTVVIDFIAEDE